MNLEFDPQALTDLHYWAVADKKKAQRILRLLEEIQKTPLTVTGMPEPLKHMLAGCRSRRIDREHRLVYAVEKGHVVVLACRYHY